MDIAKVCGLTTEISEYYGHSVTARTHDEPYSMWRRVSTYLLCKIIPADMLRADNTEHTQPILFITVPA
ncbi:MAG: hypothetical protein HDR88_12115 [Bacteroides sp.]|nr:hypothetical protein [Bacteroides sp.]